MPSKLFWIFGDAKHIAQNKNLGYFRKHDENTTNIS